MNDVKKRVKMAMLEHGEISAAELARRIGMQPQNLNRKFTGATKWTVEDLERIAGALGCELVIDFKPLQASETGGTGAASEA